MARRATSSTKERNAPQDILPKEAAPAGPVAAKTTRRGSKSKLSRPAAKSQPAADELSQIAAQPMDAPAAEAEEQLAAPAPSAASLASADAQAASPAARWDAGSGTASFDWPIIEAVAAASGPNQAMAKLLLAARAEGANSRWPF